MSDVFSGAVSGGMVYRGWGWSDCDMASTIDLGGCHWPGTEKWRSSLPRTLCKLQEAPTQRYTRTLRVLSAQVLLCIVRHVNVTYVNVAGEEECRNQYALLCTTCPSFERTGFRRKAERLEG